MAGRTKKIKIFRLVGASLQEVLDEVAEEDVADIFVNKKFVSHIFCSPFDCDSLVFGFLFTQGIINRAGDVKSISFEERHNKVHNKRNFYVVVEKSPTGVPFFTASAETVPVNHKEFSVSYEKILSLMGELSELGEIFKRTGGTHIAALSNGDVLFSSFEDVSRRSAVQKAIGYALKINRLQDYPVLLTSARVNSDIMKQAKRANIKVVVSVSAPTSFAVAIAKESHITLIGFARENRMNIYTVPRRIIE